MVVALSLSAIAGAILAIGLSYPFIGAWSLVVAPFAGSCAAALAGLAGARVSDRRSETDVSVDEMVGQLRDVVGETRRAEQTPDVAPTRRTGTSDLR